MLGGASGMNWGNDPSPWMSSPQQPRWRGGTMLQDAVETQQRDFDKGTPLFWDDGNEKMQILATVQTDERDNGDFDDGVRVIHIKKNGSAPGSMFGEFKRAVAKAGGGFGTGCQIYFALVGTEPSKKKGGKDRRIYICHFVPMPPPGDAMVSGPDPGQQPVQQPPVQQTQQPQWQGQPAQQQYQQAPPMQQPAYAQAGPPAQNGQQPQWQGQPAPQQQGPPPGPPAQPQGQPQWQGQQPIVQQAPPQQYAQQPQWQGQPAPQAGQPVQQPQWQGQPPVQQAPPQQYQQAGPPASDSPFVAQQGPAPVQSPAPPQQPQWQQPQQAGPPAQQQPPWPQQ